MATPVAVDFALVAADGRRVTVRGTGGGCMKAARLTATQTSAEVDLRLVRYDVKPTRHLFCSAVLTIWTRSVTLRRALAGRKLATGRLGTDVPYFDGRQLAKVGWLPKGARRPVDRQFAGRDWLRTYRFGKRSEAPIQIDQIPGNRLDMSELTSSAYVRHHVDVQGRRGESAVQGDVRHGLAEDRLAWFAHGYTYIVESVPRWGWQHPFSPATLLRVADAMTLPPTYIKADFQGVPARPCQVAAPHQAISFRIEPDVPQPACWKVRAFRSVTVVNATGDYGQRPHLITGALRGIGRFRLEPGMSARLQLAPGRRFAVGDHCVTVKMYGRSCLAIWVAPGSGLGLKQDL